jgi:hypothetical protein
VEIDDHFNPSVEVTKLRSADARYLLEFVLRPLAEWQHQDWHSYELHMTDTTNGKKASLISIQDHTLFLDKMIEPEVPALCAGLRTAVSTGEPYTFEPIDERDFRLEVTQEARGIRVKVQYDSIPASEEYGWPVGLIVDKTDLLRFADELESAFSRLVSRPRP